MPFEPLIDSNGDPAAPIIRSLLSARRELASAWLSLSDAEVKSRWNEGLRKFQRALLDCGIRDQLLFPEDATLVDQIMERMKRPRPPAGAILAGALYCFPHHYGRVIPFDEIPDFLMDSHLRQCLAFPLVFRNEGESEQYRRYLME
ncbi:MAG TPA: hypothetical protein VMD30_14110, partial [Tepidisphaeraceae bacterium]|nr:hypothetical protein [Tepidisphaeraceae bacterium]